MLKVEAIFLPLFCHQWDWRWFFRRFCSYTCSTDGLSASHTKYLYAYLLSVTMTCRTLPKCTILIWQYSSKRPKRIHSTSIMEVNFAPLTRIWRIIFTFCLILGGILATLVNFYCLHLSPSSRESMLARYHHFVLMP